MKITDFCVKSSFVFVLLIPGLLMVMKISSSSSAGFFLSLLYTCFVFSILILNGNCQYKVRKKNILLLIGLFFFVLLHLFIIYLNEDVDFLRALFSFLLFTLLLYGCFLFNGGLRRISDDVLHEFLVSLYWFSIVLGFASAILYNYNFFERKSLIFFYEPSHYSLVFCPLLLYYFSSLKSFGSKVLTSSYLLILGVALMNLVFFCCVFLTLFVCFKQQKLKFILLPFSIFLIFNLVNLSGNDTYTYFSSRLLLSPDSDNLSVLVFLSGYERALLSFIDSFGFGFGFQQMGNIGPLGTIQNNLTDLGAKNLNVDDGSILLSKIVFEFGLIGIISILVYLFYFLKIVLSFNFLTIGVKEKIASSIYISFFIYIFIRGGGYFMPLVFMFITACFYLYRKGDVNTSSQYL